MTKAEELAKAEEEYKVHGCVLEGLESLSENVSRKIKELDAAYKKEHDRDRNVANIYEAMIKQETHNLFETYEKIKKLRRELNMPGYTK